MESVPPRLYGGTERIVSYLTEELVRLGHEVTLVRQRETPSPAAQLVGCASHGDCASTPMSAIPIPYYMLMLDRVRDARGRI